MSYRLLAPDEPHPVVVEDLEARSHFLLVCEHAGRRVPRGLGDLGLPAHEWDRHIAWDIGAAGMSRVVAAALDATLVMQRYSRLVIDCNRSPTVASSMPEISESTVIPGNRAMDPAQRQARIDEIFTPFHQRVSLLMDQRDAAQRETVLVTLHSFTPVFKGDRRPWEVGVLYNRDTRLAHALLEVLGSEPGLCVGDNQPYQVSDETDYTVPVHGEQRGVVHVEIEVRQDLLADQAGQQYWGERLADWLTRAWQGLAAPQLTRRFAGADVRR